MKKTYYSRITFSDLRTKEAHTIQSPYAENFAKCYNKMQKKISTLIGEKYVINECSVNEIYK